MKVAVADRSTVIETVHVPVPEQSPDQPVNVDPGAGVAESVTEAPWLSCAEQTGPQVIAAGELVTVPEPDPPAGVVRLAAPSGDERRLALRELPACRVARRRDGDALVGHDGAVPRELRDQPAVRELVIDNDWIALVGSFSHGPPNPAQSVEMATGPWRDVPVALSKTWKPAYLHVLSQAWLAVRVGR